MPHRPTARPMAPRVAHLTTAHPAFDPRIFRKQLLTLVEAGFETHLVAPARQSEVRQGVQITALPQTGGRYRRVRLHPRMYRAARRLRADLYHFHDPELMPVAYLLKRSTGARVVYDMHENYRWKGPVLGRCIRAVERWCFSWVDHVVVANPSQQRIPAASGAPSTVVANYYKPLAKSVHVQKAPLEDLRLIYTGVMSIERGLLSMLDVAACFKQRRPAWRLDLAGVCYLDDDRRQAERRIREQGLEGMVRRCGWDTRVPWTTLMRMCHRAHVGLLLLKRTPNYLGIVPTKFYEYLGAGLPVLCSDMPPYRTLVEKHGCGDLVPPGDEVAAFQVLQSWVEEPARYRALAQAAREAAPNYRWRVMGRRLVRLYEELL